MTKNYVEFLPEHYEYYDNASGIKKLIMYFIDSKYRKSVLLTKYVESQMSVALEINILVDKAIELKNKYGDNHDAISVEALKFVKSLVKYKTDQANYGYGEKWEDISEAIERGNCDCETGATIVYCLCRLAGVPSYKVKMVAATVFDPNTNGEGGHAFCIYRPQPHWFVILDWCYYYSWKNVMARDKFYITGKTIKGDDNKYKRIWYVFDDENTYVEFRPTFTK